MTEYRVLTLDNTDRYLEREWIIYADTEKAAEISAEVMARKDGLAVTVIDGETYPIQ